MDTIHVALQDGFDDDAVEIRLGDHLVYHRDGVTTRTQIGLADTFDVGAEPPATVDVRLPHRGLATTIDVSLPYLGVSVADGALVARQSAEEFRYA